MALQAPPFFGGERETRNRPNITVKKERPGLSRCITITSPRISVQGDTGEGVKRRFVAVGAKVRVT